MTSDERRKAAARLRERPVARNIKEAYVSIVQAVGVRPCLLSHEGESGDRFDAAAYADVLDHLADLIDPTCEVVPFDEESMRLPHCSRCGQPILKPWPNHCPNCGARVVCGDGE